MFQAAGAELSLSLNLLLEVYVAPPDVDKLQDLARLHVATIDFFNKL